MFKDYIRNLMLYIICGLSYVGIEYLYRGHSHYSMFILAGICGVFFIDTPNNIWSYNLDYRLQVIISTILCTFGEGITGIIVNIILKLNVWDYSSLPFTFFFGQCNLIFTLAWLIIISFAIPICDAYNYYICKDEECPYYKINDKVIFKMKERK